MPSALETLVKILKLEQTTGYQDKAVIGGLRTLAEHWSRDAHAQAKKPEHHLLVDELAALIASYQGLGGTDERHESIKYMLGRIVGKIPPPADLLPRYVNAASAPPPAAPPPRTEPRYDRPDRADRPDRRAPEPRPSTDRDSNSREADNRPPRETAPQQPPQQYPQQRRPERPPRRHEAAQPEGFLDEPAREQAYHPPAQPEAEPRPLAESPFERPAQPPAPAPAIAFATRRPPKQSVMLPRRRYHDPQRQQEALHRLRSQVTILDGVGPKIAEKLAELGLVTVEDVVYNIPRRYDDFTQMPPIAKLLPGQTVTIVGEVKQAVLLKGRRGQEVFQVTISDGTGILPVSFFGATYLRGKLEKGMRVVMRGKVDQFLGKPAMTHPEWEPLEQDALHMRQIVPVYALNKNVTLNLVRKVTRAALDACTDYLPDPLPESVLERVGLPDIGWAVQQLHFPESWEALELAQKRLSFDQLLLIQLGVMQARREWQGTPALALQVADAWYEGFLGSLPYTLTGAQTRSLQQIRGDLAQTVPMNRLLQGDVGAGKTAVAAAALLMTVCGSGTLTGVQGALMAPTGILAEQHYKSISKLIENSPAGGQINIKLLTSATPAQERADTLWGVGEGTVHILIGTHALLQDDVHFFRLGLAIIDEQHRFGVEQRGQLRGKGTNPHVLVMTATPIPRTLALTMYADLDLSILDEMPPGRSPIDTKILFPRERMRAYSFVQSQVEKGRQAFIVYPLVEASESEALRDVKSAVEEFERLSKEVFPHLRLGLLHGKLSAAGKDAAMVAFSRNETQVLVCTSVVEVGIDVPNATVMLVEGANRFGLAQLHQFRGRVGRGQHASFCLLIPDDGDITNERLQALESTADGFKLAELDWEMRGAGELLGTQQSGGAARLGEFMDHRLVEQAQLECLTLFEEDPWLEMPHHAYLREQLHRAAAALNAPNSDQS